MLPALEQSAPQNLVVRVAGDEEHFDVGTAGRKTFRQLTSAELRHHDVAQEKIDDAAVVGGHAHGVLAVDRLEHGIALRLEHTPRETAHAVLVLDEENGLTGDRRLTTLDGTRRTLVALPRH